MDWLVLFMILCLNSYTVFGNHHDERIYFPGEIRDVIPPSPQHIYNNFTTLAYLGFPSPQFVKLNLTLKPFPVELFKPPIEENPRVTSESSVVGVSAPEEFISCGNTFLLPSKMGLILTEDGTEKEYPYYTLNETAEELTSKGFQIIEHKVEFGDVLTNFSYSNGTCKGNLAFTDFLSGAVVVGGGNASIQRSYYMAQIGEKRDTFVTWLCDGVLINKRWILSAAHCFAKPGVNPNVVRLGDYDLSNPFDPLPDSSTNREFIRDYPIHQLIPHPEFKVNERYHDLVLIQIPRKIPKHAHNFVPICLPWDSDTNKNLVGNDVTLTGWGATEFRGSKTTVLQEVNLTVFNTAVCAQAYTTISDTKVKYPDGITEDKILCVGWEEDGKDACGGDSGAPLVYEDSQRYFLGGIVSGGFGCGLKQYPGLYIPINNPKYLQWIKDVAFIPEDPDPSESLYDYDYE